MRKTRLAFSPKLIENDHQIKMGFSVDRKERGIKITQFSYIEPYEIVVFISFKKWWNSSNFIWLKLINFLGLHKLSIEKEGETMSYLKIYQ